MPCERPDSWDYEFDGGRYSTAKTLNGVSGQAIAKQTQNRFNE